MSSLVANLVIDTIEQSQSDVNSSDGPFDYEMTFFTQIVKSITCSIGPRSFLNSIWH